MYTHNKNIYLATYDQASREIMCFANLSENLIDLICQLPGRCDDKGPQTILRTPLKPKQTLQDLKTATL